MDGRSGSNWMGSSVRLFWCMVAGAVMAMSGSAGASLSEGELKLRKGLGIPADAREVIVFAQSSHLDPDWLLTADQYQRLLTDETLDRVLHELSKDPRYVYSVECLFFFKRYWDTHPDKRDALRQYANQGRIRFTGTGITTPDTLLPEQDNLVRDYLAGYHWLKDQGINVNSRLAYLPDCFGHTPTLPAILNQLGYKYTAFARIDGMYFIATDYRPRSAYPRPGSSAELLEKEHGTLDFVWKAQDGSEVLAHWMAFTYLQGDMIDSAGVAYIFGIHAGIKRRSPKYTNARIDSYIRELRPLSPTGYMFCPIGGDFNHPIPNLNKIMDAYNEMRYPDTGVYAVLAGLEDYMELVECHRDRLPVLQLDPNPLWMGFYSSRPELKQRCRRLSRSLLIAEGLGVLAEDMGKSGAYPDLSKQWGISLFSNHHDFITGTSPNRVYKREQIPFLKNAQEQVDEDIKRLRGLLEVPSGSYPTPVNWEQEGSRLIVENDFYRIEMDERQGGCITSWLDKREGMEVLSWPSNDVILYRDTGGLWRMGHELVTGKFKEFVRASELPASISAQDEKGVLVVSVTSQIQGRPFERRIYFRSDEPMVRMKMRGSVGRRRTATVCFRTEVSPGRTEGSQGFFQEVPFGVVERALKKNFEPTFWAVKNWVDLVDASGDFGVNMAVAAPASVHADEEGNLEMVALRYAPQERVLGIPVLSFPAIGSDPAEHEFDYAFWPHGKEGWLERRVFSMAQAVLDDSWIDPAKPNLEELAFSMIHLDREDVVVTSVKRPEGAGEDESQNAVIVRLLRYSPQPVTVNVSYSGRDIKKAFMADGLERTKHQLPINDGRVEISMTRPIATLLLKL